jgi:hypothetical protein
MQQHNDQVHIANNTRRDWVYQHGELADSEFHYMLGHEHGELEKFLYKNFRVIVPNICL